MLKTYHIGILNSFYLFTFILFLLHPDILPQNKDKTTKWPEPKFEHITMKDGLPDQSVWCMLQDHLGFIWFGNLTGLVRYDGYTMTVYSHYSDNKVDKSFNPVNAIYEDKLGNIWIATYGAVKSFDRKSETFTKYLNEHGNITSISSDTALCFYEDSKNRFWIGTLNGLNLMNRKTKQFERYYIPDTNLEINYSQSISTIIEDKLSWKLIIGSLGSGLWSFDPSKKIFSKINLHNTTNRIINFDQINNLTQSSDGTIWISTNMGLINYRSENEFVKYYQVVQTEKYTPENEIVTGIVEMDGLILAGTLGGKLVCLDPEKEMFMVYSNDANDPNSLSTSSIFGIRAILKDSSGVLWVSAADFGLNKWDRFKTKFSSYRYNEDNKKSLGNNQIMSMIEDRKGIIWIGTFGGGFIKYDRKNNDFTRFTHNPNNGNSLSDNTVQTICEDPEETGVLWIGTAYGGLNKFDSRINQFIHYIHDPNNVNSLSHNYVMYLLPGEKNSLWVCTFGGGLDRFDIKSGKFKHFLNNPKDSTSINSNSVWYCYKDRQGTLWIGNTGGYKATSLSRYNDVSNSFRSFSALNKNWDVSQSLVICEDKLDNFWVGDLISGLFLFDRSKEEYVLRLTQDDGLSFNAVMSILEDEPGNLWISTYNGLSKFDPVEKKFRNYYEEDGLSNNKFFFHSAFKSRTGEMFFGGENGFTWFYPDDIKDDQIPPLVVIDKVSLFNHPDEKLEIDGFISEMEEVEFPYNHNDLRFDYVGLHFGDPSKNKYKYRLENFDDDWVDAGTQRNAVYTNLDPGEYVFRVNAANHDGVWNEEGKSLRIIINHPYWATWWAYGFYFLFAIGLIYVLRKYEVNRLRLKNQVKLDEVLIKEREETDKMKSRFFANISHEFRTPLTLILGPTEKIISKFKDEEIQKESGLIKRNATRLLGLINQLLDLSRLEAGKLKLKASRSNIVSFVKGITMSFESIAERKDISLKIKSEREEIEVYFDRDMMAKILSNLLSNAFKFTPEGGKITVSIEPSSFPPLSKGELKGGFVEISVSDTGIGISEEELPKLFDRFYQVDSSQTREYEGSGLGLALTKELVELHRGTIKAKSNSGEGSEFIIELLLGREHLNDDEVIKGTEQAVILSPDESGMKNLQEFNVIDSSSSVKRLTPQNDIEAKQDKTIILVVEDNKDVREYIKDSLGDGFKVEEAANGEQGLRKAEQLIPDLIISDVMMPKMDGNELARRIKNNEKTSHIPIILLTARSEQESRLEGLETGADDYLTKPFDTKELLIRIKNLIAIRRNLQKKYSGEQIILKKDPNLSRPGEARAEKLRTIDEKFLSKALEIVEKHLPEEEFSIEEFGEEVGMSRVQLHRKLKALTGKSASLYLRSVRLAKAKNMIEEKKGNISEIAYSVGFSSPAYFSACFKEEFGYPPSEIPH